MTIAVFKSGDTKPEANEVLMMLVIVGRRTSRFSYSNAVGTGSRSHDLGTVFWRISETYVTVHHEMSCLSPNFDFDVLTFSNSILYALFNGENRF